MVRTCKTKSNRERAKQFAFLVMEVSSVLLALKDVWIWVRESGVV